MDFQSQQEEAKQSTTRLIALLVLGLIAIIAVVSALMMGLFYYSSGTVQPLSAIGVAAPLTTIGVVGASLVKSAQIRSGGGSYVAASMGGRPVDFNTLDPAEKQLSNIVEEIAIASGMPVPAVFVLDQEPSINAFAAGWTADNAAIGVTRGTLQHLNRRELQGVIAHEFAHIRNGDTRIKTRIIGWVFGIAVITVLGRILLQHLWWAPRRRDDRDNSAMLLLAAGIGLVVIGSVGTLFARMIQAAVSRQREYLADASAVQYTRDPSGIGEALMKIGGMTDQNRIRAAHATEASHLFFSSAMSNSLASHPPLTDRIKRLLPSWDGEFAEPDLVESSSRRGRPQAGQAPQARQQGGFLPGQVAIPGMPGNHGLPIDPTILAAGGAGASSSLAGAPARPAPGDTSGNRTVEEAITQPATEARYGAPVFTGPTDAHIHHARALLARIPEMTQGYLHTRQGAVAAVVGLLVTTDPSSRPGQLAQASSLTGIEAEYLDAASRVISELDRSLQLPAIDIALHSIRETPFEFKQALAQAIETIESSRHDQDLFRWMLRRVMLRHLEDQYDDGSARHAVPLDQLAADAVTVYAMMSWFNSAGPSQTQGAFEAALGVIGSPVAAVPALEELTVERVDGALERLSHLDRVGREAFVMGATAAVLHDGTTTADEAELIRVVADAVRLPVPPLLPV